ncbi:MAG: hypothetical protein Q4C56_01525 [Peptococcaceae bacterium]|nr:hypothetical protein [Peptococcaceae bacterium]
MGISRDLFCAQRVEALSTMGAMEEELSLSGCAYLAGGEVYYRVSPNVEEMARFVLDAPFAERWATPIQPFTTRQLLLTGEEDSVLADLKRAAARALAEAFPPAFFDLITAATATPPASAAWPIIAGLIDAYDGRFLADECQLLARLLGQCITARQIDAAHAKVARDWLNQTRQQMTQDSVVLEQHQRTFYGFLYQGGDGTWQVKSNQSLDKVLAAQRTLETGGTLCGPILEKTFYYSDARTLPTLRSRFADWLTALSGDVLARALPLLASAPSPLSTSWQAQATAQLPHLPAASQTALRHLAQLWHTPL